VKPGAHIQTVIVGSGVVGLAIARKFARQGHEVLVLEAEDSGHHHISARNSQVMHSSILCTPGTLKARFCKAGHAQMLAFCQTHHVDHAQCEKLIIATQEEQQATLAGLIDRAGVLGLKDLRLLSAAEAARLEPNLRCHGALLVRQTGIVDAPGFMRALEGDATRHGALFATRAPLRTVRIGAKGFDLDIADATRTRLRCTHLINAAGLGAWDVARGIKGYAGPAIPPQNHVKAGYFALTTGPAPFARLIYPAPGSDGAHALRDMGGGTRFGPTTEYLDPPRIDYRFDQSAEALEPKIRRFWPDLPRGALRPDTCGIRPRITAPGQPLADFRIDGPRDHKIPGLVQLFGIESPGLTSSLALADHVWTQLAAS